MRSHLLRLGLACALMVSGAGCGDDDGGSGDNQGNPDASTDQPDASTVDMSQSGTILLLETAFDGLPAMGDGPFAVIKVQDAADIVAPSYEVAPGSPFACKAWEMTPEQYADPGIDFGAIQFAIDMDGPVFPPCHFMPGVGWGCPGGGGTGGDIAAVGGPEWKITDAAANFSADDVGRYVNITGAGAGNNGMFPITGFDTNEIHYLNEAGVAEPGTAGMYVTLAGMGPAGQTDPISDDATLTLDVTAGGTGKFQDFSKAVGFGDHFTMDDASAPLLSDVPMDGSAFTLSCGGAGGECNSATATALDIVTSDGSIEGLPPFLLPMPTSKSVRIFCIFLVPDVEVPEEVSQFLADSGATRVRTIYTRGESVDEIEDEARVTVVAGHALMGFTDP